MKHRGRKAGLDSRRERAEEGKGIPKKGRSVKAGEHKTTLAATTARSNLPLFHDTYIHDKETHL